MENDKTIFLEVFGDNPINRVLDFLVVHEDFDYSMTDIAKHSGVGYATLKLFWSKLEENKIVKQTRIVGKAKMYRLYLENPVVKKFRDFFWETAHQKVKEELRKEEMLTA
ncbi:hypothetical protein J4413_02805 [Candidatus Woesearchaeota archaeon]|nr:hypothetical protein [Candidatus Woesearchaeota archaeon]